MESWVYFFSQFTSEALFFQALAICVLVMAYTAYWILKKRRHGVASDEDAIPVSVVRTYLSELITDAHSLRAQLFGLLSDAGGPPATARMPLVSSDTSASAVPTTEISAAAAANIENDPELKTKFSELEKQLAAQTAALATLTTEKSKLEKDLAAAKAGADSGAGDDGASAELQSKIQELEDKLAEYSVIEDDLANLKRLQQENVQLKAALESKGVSAAAAVAAVSEEEPAAQESETAVPETKTAAPETETTDEPAPAPPTQEAVSEEPEPATQAAPEPVVPNPEAGGDPEFDSLAAQVEQTLKSSTPEEQKPAEAASKDETGDAATTDESPIDNMGKSDEDLLSEFEKMLNS